MHLTHGVPLDTLKLIFKVHKFIAMSHIVGLKELRQNTAKYVRAVQMGRSFIIVKQSKPLFRIAPIDDEGEWEQLIDFTRVKKGGVKIQDLLRRL